MANSPNSNTIGNDKHSFGTLTGAQVDPATGETYWGDGNPSTNYNITTNTAFGAETDLKIHIRGGPDIVPTSIDADGTAHLTAPAGSDPTNAARAAWNFDYAVLTTKAVLGEYGLKIAIAETAAGGGFLHSATYDFDQTSHIWTSESGHSAFGGDDFKHTASPDLQAHLTENSENVAFILGDFGPTLAAATAAGNVYDIQVSAYAPQNGKLVALSHDIVTLAGPMPA